MNYKETTNEHYKCPNCDSAMVSNKRTISYKFADTKLFEKSKIDLVTFEVQCPKCYKVWEITKGAKE